MTHGFPHPLYQSGYEAGRKESADEIERLREALGNVSRMKVFPDAQTNQFTLATAIHIARAALGEGK